MAGIPSIARMVYLVLAVLLLACPICSLGSRQESQSPKETEAWATITPVDQTATPIPPATRVPQPTLQPTPTPSPTAVVVPTEPTVDTPTAVGSVTDTPPSVRRVAPGRRSTGQATAAADAIPAATPTTAATATAAARPATATPVPRQPRDVQPALRPEMLSEPGAQASIPGAANLADAAQLHPLLQLRPELATIGAPDWLSEGTRVIYQAMSATLTADPNDTGSSGAGLLQYDLVALDAGSAVSSVKFLLDAGTGGYTPSLVLYSLGVPGSGEYWVHPDGLRDAESLAGDELVVARLPTEIGDTTYNAVRFEYRPENALYVWMFDEESGLLLFYRHDIRLNSGAQQLSSMSLVSVRRLDVPWAGAEAPEWARTGTTFAYSGAYTPIISGVGPTPLAYSAQFRVRLASEHWWLCDVSQTTAGTSGSQSQRLSGASQLADALWIPPEGLQAMQRGQVLDSDPTTGIELVVTQTGRDTVVLSETGALHQATLVYDAREGILLASEFESYTPLVTTNISLELVQWP